LKRNREHFGQAVRTPFATREMLELVPFTTNSDMAKKALKGEEIEIIHEEVR
jgi:hypothetical protein